MQSPSENDAQQKRQRDTGMADEKSEAAVTAQAFEVELGAGYEQEHQDTELADQRESTERLGRKQPALHRRQQGSEQQRAEQQARGHFADYGRLAEPAQQQARCLRREQHDEQLQQEERERRGQMREPFVGR